ncbi:poly(A)-specific ribonuclease PNLDC1 [Folsomia candida]|uniref:poly(A)-specific ribonuclease PNLDC1 n=1 Tax=Folsomia candida TaxID=158441 RepID=UPI000B9052E8|nr:poly(A)-specific ribonuclease PNLDC1 [Folsomia candida]
MAEVTRSNFEDLLPEIKSRMRTCNFISLDAEYTGLHPEDIKDKNSLFDTPDQRYVKLRDKVVSKFAICQIGLAFFERSVENEKEHMVNAYNFFVFPVSFDAYAKREIISSQVSCINFLTKNDFDFNKYFKQGVPYLNKEKLESVRKYLDVNRHFMHTCEDLDPHYFPKRIEFLSDKDINEIIDRLEGFSKVVKLMQEFKKPIVGHNMLLDIMLLYHQFVQELPSDYFEFKKQVHDLFPSVFDTKATAYGIASLRRNQDPDDHILSDTNLFALYSNVSALLQNTSQPIIIPENDTYAYHEALVLGRTTNLETGVKTAKCHTAGFDAVVTGVVFLKLGFLAARPRILPDYRQLPHPTLTEIFKRLSSWKDEINIGRCIIPNIHLSQPDPISKRPDWIKVHPIPGHTFVDPVALRGLMVKYGDFEIQVITQGEVIIACGGIGCHRRVLRDLESKGYRISTVKKPTSSSEIWSCAARCGTAFFVLSIAFLLYYRRR